MSSAGRVTSPLEAAPEEIRGTDGRGFRMWSTRRRNQFRAAILGLARLAAVGDFDRLLLSFATITEFLAPAIPAGVSSLPRGYEWAVNFDREPSFKLNGDLLNPAVRDKFPSTESIVRFARDLQDGWLQELATVLGLEGVRSFLEVW